MSLKTDENDLMVHFNLLPWQQLCLVVDSIFQTLPQMTAAGGQSVQGG